MELFLENGHLTDEALQASLQGTLEVAEHLSFCDTCLVRYTALLEDDVLLTPAQPLAQSVMDRVRRRVVHVFFNRYAAVAAAVVLAVTFWSTGLFRNIATIPIRESQPPTSYSETVHEVKMPAAARVNAFFRNASDAFSHNIASLFD